MRTEESAQTLRNSCSQQYVSHWYSGIEHLHTHCQALVRRIDLVEPIQAIKILSTTRDGAFCEVVLEWPEALLAHDHEILEISRERTARNFEFQATVKRTIAHLLRI